MVLEQQGTYKDHEYRIYINPDLGIRCGYVKTNIDYYYVDDEEIEYRYDVHGGITYISNSWPDWNEEELFEETIIGFDCCQLGDGSLLHVGHIWTAEEVKEECFKLIDQIVKEERVNE